MTTVKQMIETLKEYPEDATVQAFDPDLATSSPVTGYLYDPQTNIVEICTDDQEE